MATIVVVVCLLLFIAIVITDIVASASIRWCW
jgi:hypothetical protein